MKSIVPDWVFYLAIVAGLVLYANRERGPVIPPADLPELGPLLPSESPRDERILVNIDAPASGVGTAFASSGEGDWITARHVVDSCDEVGLRINPRQLIRIASAEIYQDADLAQLNTGWTREPLATDLLRQRQIGEPGYFIGFPQGRPGEVVGSLLSRGRMQVRGRYRTEEAVLIWSEVGRTRGLTGSLGGLSGGPVLDADGELIGVVAAETPRRGRIYTVSPRNLRRIVGSTDGSAQTIEPSDYAVQADRLRRERRVT
ncbi:MAG: trypsin-like peptidase domain-containing protein, partial [Litorimonas sp.]